MVGRERYEFRIPIGDWSEDGHSRVEWYTASALKPIEHVREAYLEARRAIDFLGWTPEDFVSDYGDNTISKHFRAKIQALSGIDLSSGPVYDDDSPVDPKKLAEYIVWFINQGDPTLKAKLIETDVLPMLPFYGFDKKKRHIGHFGYGLFED